ncbi:expressed protein [Phakopsora pachyrhizi]|uniref:Expressed protein n=1 Tax=Phakopsora pachyrhizi TaxID=170000 RepID=A0AAV0AVA7_PHAPC|nr:expressed protein [Phakopsora pachyrhizi]
MIVASRSNRKNFCFWLFQVALGCLIVEAGFIERIFRGKSETSKLKVQREPLISKIGSNHLAQQAVGKVEQLSSSKGYLVDEIGQPLVLKFAGKKTLDDIFDEVTRKYFNQVPTLSKNPIEPSALMVEIKEIVEEVKKKRFVRIEKTDKDENRERLDKILSKRLEEASKNYSDIMNSSGDNREIGEIIASAYDKIEEALGKSMEEDIVEAEKTSETLNIILKDIDTVQRATKYILEQGIVRGDEISKTLEAMGTHFYGEAWFQKNILDRSRREEDFDPFFSSIDIKDYIINHPSLKQHRVILKALNKEKWSSSILKFLLLYSELMVSHFGDQISVSANNNINEILKGLIEGKTLDNNVWINAFSGAVPDSTHYNSRMIYHLILYHAYSFNNPEKGLNIIGISERIRGFKHVLRIQQKVLNFYRTKKFMGFELKIISEYKNYMDEISKMRLENHGFEATVVDNFQKLRTIVSEVKFPKAVVTRALVEWKSNVNFARLEVLMHLNKEKTNFKDMETVNEIDYNFPWERSEIIRLTKIYNESYFRNADLSLELSINNWLTEVKDEINTSKKKETLRQKIYSGIFSH